MATDRVDIVGTNGISASQMSEFFRLANIPGSHINHDTIQALIEKRNPFGNGEGRSILKESNLLKPVSCATVPKRTESFTAERWYQGRKGLYVSGSFAYCFDLRARKLVTSAPERLYVASLLKANAYDRDIRKELPENHLSTLEDIAALIEAQPDGKSGILLTNGYMNIFYVEGKNGKVFAVSAYWCTDVRAWRVDDWMLDMFCDGNWNADHFGDWNWYAGHQVLCPSNAVL
ncbi:MAG: hypothetical protein WCJ25_00970 [Candidatus Moraniibacteriota bacterium]